MGAYIVTGLQGHEHVTSEDEGAFNAGVVGTGKYVMKTAEQFAAEIVSNNIVRIKSGDLVNQGRHMRIETNDYEDMTIENGAQSVKRNDLIVMRYKKDTSTTIELESAELVVIKGTAGATATDPTYTSGDILAGATQDDFPLYRVSLNGLNIEKVTPLFSTVPNLNELNTKIASYFAAIKYFSLTAGKWTDMIQFTIPESGIYEISWDAEFSSGAGSYIEGTRIRFNSDADMQYVHMSVPNQISAHSYHVANTCTKGDVVRIQIYAAVARNITNQKVVLRKIASELN